MRTREEYLEDRKSGHEFEAFCQTLFARRGIRFERFVGAVEQSDGENSVGIECKLDRIMSTSKKLYIETSEKVGHAGRWRRSGIWASDNSWLFAIGDYKRVYVFTIRELREASALPFKRVSNKTNSAKGFLLPIEVAERMAVARFDVEAEDLAAHEEVLAHAE